MLSPPFAMTKKILFVEDSQEDVELVQRALAKINASDALIHYYNADAALEYLKQPGHAQSPLAHHLGFILLDIHLPGLSGLEALQKIKSDPVLKSIPVVMLTTSSDPKDIALSYQNGANSFVSKPVDINDFLVMIHKMICYWMKVCKLPSQA